MISAVARPMPLANAVITATLSVKPHASPFRLRLIADACCDRDQHGRTARCNSGFICRMPASQATPELIRRHAMRAEDLGLDDVWVSEHIIVPRAQLPAFAVVL